MVNVGKYTVYTEYLGMDDGKLILKTFRAGFGSGGDCLSTHNFVVRARVDQLLILGMVIPPLIENPDKGYIKP